MQHLRDRYHACPAGLAISTYHTQLFAPKRTGLKLEKIFSYLRGILMIAMKYWCMFKFTKRINNILITEKTKKIKSNTRLSCVEAVLLNQCHPEAFVHQDILFLVF